MPKAELNLRAVSIVPLTYVDKIRLCVCYSKIPYTPYSIYLRGTIGVDTIRFWRV